jgi:hypothetical protein
MAFLRASLHKDEIQNYFEKQCENLYLISICTT